jgi:murein DD-endopeptidase MepM/ murein hydrolase activator NlpD
MSSGAFSHSTQFAVLLFGALFAAPVFAATAADLAPPKGCDIVGAGTAVKPATPPSAVFPPAQLDIRTPLEPTVLAANGRNYLLYELHLRNFTDAALTLRGLEVFDADDGKQRLLANLTTDQFRQRLRLTGDDGQQSGQGAPRLAAGQSAVAFLCLAFDAGLAVPGRLQHRLLLDGATADAPPIGTRRTPLHVLGRPLAGSNWTADNGPGLESHHRMGLFVAAGQAQLSRRYAIDWKRYRDGRIYAGDARDVRSYFSYGAQVLAVAGGTVVAARDGQPDNIPRTKDGFTPAVPVTMESLPGNFIVIDLGDGQYAQYAHLQPGSLRIKAGDRVVPGQVLARIGNSGDARWPHLHFQVASTPDFMASEGLPFLIDGYRLEVGEGQWEQRSREYPIGDGVVDFGP